MRNWLSIFALDENTITLFWNRSHVKVKNISSVLVEVNPNGLVASNFLFLPIQQVNFASDLDYNLFRVGLDREFKSIVIMVTKLNVFIVEGVLEADIVEESDCDVNFLHKFQIHIVTVNRQSRMENNFGFISDDETLRSIDVSDVEVVSFFRNSATECFRNVLVVGDNLGIPFLFTIRNMMRLNNCVFFVL